MNEGRVQKSAHVSYALFDMRCYRLWCRSGGKNLFCRAALSARLTQLLPILPSPAGNPLRHAATV